jgi:hypothetical protein
MISPVHSVPAVTEKPATPPPAPQPARQTVKSGTLSEDQVTLKSAGQVDHDHDGD